MEENLEIVGLFQKFIGSYNRYERWDFEVLAVVESCE
jgi:hypothetical protein